MSTYKKEFFIHPVDHQSNLSIARHQSMEQIEMYNNAECYVGRQKVYLPVYPVTELLYESFKRMKILSFYAFVKKSKYARRQFCHSQNVKSAILVDVTAHVANLIEKAKKLKEIT